jgi:hypothetical protein
MQRQESVDADDPLAFDSAPMGPGDVRAVVVERPLGPAVRRTVLSVPVEVPAWEVVDVAVSRRRPTPSRGSPELVPTLPVEVRVRDLDALVDDAGRTTASRSGAAPGPRRRRLAAVLVRRC